GWGVGALGEGKLGGGRGKRRVLYVTVGTGVGGGLVIDGSLLGAGRPAVAEIGHLRPGLDAIGPEQTIESIASGRGIEAAARELGLNLATAKAIAEAADQGDRQAATVMDRACQALGWGIAQTITLAAVEIGIVGGGL